MNTAEAFLLLSEIQERVQRLAAFVDEEAAKLKAELNGCQSEKVKITHAVAVEFGVPYIEMFNKHGRASDSIARHVAMMLCYQGNESSGSVGRFFGKDHGTVLNAVKQTQARMDTDEKFRDRVTRLEENIKAK